MKDLHLRYSYDDDLFIEKMQLLLTGILTGDTAIAEPSSAGLPWWATSLITTIAEAYFDNALNEDTVIMGIACPEQRMVQVFLQDYALDDPQHGLLAIAELHNATDYVALYLVV